MKKMKKISLSYKDYEASSLARKQYELQGTYVSFQIPKIVKNLMSGQADNSITLQ